MDEISSSRPNYFFIDLLRCLAAIAVVIIHVIGPYRNVDIGSSNWLVAISFNMASRWAVPVFIMITGALMLADSRPFNLRHYLVHRCRKAVVPFVVWSVGYAFLVGLSFSAEQGFGYDVNDVWPVLAAAPTKATWYHLGFYYYFLPLYLIIPLLMFMVQRVTNRQLWLLVAGWLMLTTFHFCRIKLPFMVNMVMYGGYLIFGYALIKAPLSADLRKVMVSVACLAIIAGIFGVWEYSTLAQGYSPGRFTSYKTINTALIAGACFALAYCYANRISGRLRNLVVFISQYSLGLYLIHPLILWPVRELQFLPEPTLVTVPLITVIVSVLSLGLVWLLAHVRITRWLVP